MSPKGDADKTVLRPEGTQMGGVHYSGQVYAMGVPVVGGMLTGGTSYFLDPNFGNDNNKGTSIDEAVKTMAKAYSLLTEKKNDVLYVIGGYTGVVLAETLTWAKSHTHMIGISAPVWYSPRSRISHGTANFSPIIEVTASDCLFKNIALLQGNGGADNHIALKISGSRNVFEDCSINPMLHATEGADADCIGIDLVGALQTTFRDCLIGNETIARADANCLVKFETSAGRTLFDRCIFLQFVSAATPIVINAGGAIGYNMYRDCLFLNYSANMAVSATGAFDNFNAATNVHVLTNPIFVGFTDIEKTSDSGKVFVMPYSVTANALGLGINPART